MPTQDTLCNVRGMGGSHYCFFFFFLFFPFLSNQLEYLRVPEYVGEYVFRSPYLGDPITPRSNPWNIAI